MNKLATASCLLFIQLSLLSKYAPAAYSTMRVGLPGRRYGNGYRCPSCIEPGQTTQILVIPQNTLLLTSKESPVLLFYLPRLNGTKVIELEIVDETSNEVTRLTTRSNGKSGIVLLDLAALDDPVKLENNRMYSWYLSILCQVGHQEKKISAHGNIQYQADRRGDSAPILSEPSLSRVEYFYDLGLWSDALSDIAMLQLQNLEDIAMQNIWQELLAEESLSLLTNEELFSLDFAPL